MMYGSGFYGNNGCFGNGFYGGWNLLIGMGITIIIASIIVFFIKKGTQDKANYNALETLKMKYIQGEITEDEYIKRKAVLNRK